MKKACAGVLLLWCGLASTAAGAGKPWSEARSAHFTVVSDAGEKTARAMLWELEQLRAALKTIWPWAQVDLDRPVLVVVPRDEAGMKALAPQYWEKKDSIHPVSVFVTGPDRHFIALRADVKSEDRGGTINPYHTAYWSYIALVLRSSTPHPLPLWLSLGLSEVMSNTIIRPSQLEVGRTIPWHLQTLAERARMPVPSLLAADRSSPWYQESDKRDVFDAECWAFTHYLMFGDEGAHRALLDRFIALVSEGRPPAAATELAFKDPAALDAAFALYLKRQVYLFARITSDLNVKEGAFPSRVLPPADAATSQAAFLAAMRRPVEARALIADARKADAGASGAFEVEGTLLEADGKADEARAAYASAIERGSTNFHPYYRWAALTAQTPGDAAQQTKKDQALERATTLNDRFAPAYVLLADIRLQSGRNEEALTLARRAVILDPGEMRIRMVLARALWAGAQREAAMREAREALALAGSGSERAAAQQLIDFFQRNTPA